MCFQPPKVPKHRLLNERDYSNPLFQRRRHNSPLLRWCLFILTIIFTFIFLAESTRAEPQTQSLNENSTSSSGIEDRSPLESEAGQLFIRSEDGRSQPALHLGSKVSFVVSGMVLHTSFSQTFRNPSKDSWAEGIYVFPMPEKAAISHMEMRIGERTIVGEIKEKAAAKKQYQAAKAAGRRVALVEQERPNLFTQNVANIGPGEEITVTLNYQDTVTFDAGRFSFRFPMTITPRFMPGQGQHHHSDVLGTLNSHTLIDNHENSELQTTTQMVLDNSRPWGWSAPTALVPDAHRISPPQRSASEQSKTQSHQIELSVALDAGLPLKSISSPYHDLVIEKKRDQHFITTRDSRIIMDRDFELQWQPVARKIPSAAAFTESLPRVISPPSETEIAENTDDHYALLMLAPPQQQQSHLLPRDVIFIIDTSGSMGGNSIRQAKASLTLALQRLNKNDRFNVIEFNSHHRSLFATSQTVDNNSRNQALQFVSSLNAGGGTNMAPALDAALSANSTESHLRQVVFITDGSVGNEAQLLELIHKKLGPARLFTVAIGSAPNSFFMRKSAQFGRGTFTHIGNSQEVSEKMSTLFSKLESPTLRNLSIHWPETINADVWPKKLPDLYHGEPLLIKAKLDNLDQPQTVLITGDLGGQPWQQSLSLHKPKANRVDHPGIGKLWAREKISALLDEKTRGAPESIIKSKVLSVALQHQLMSPYTSFIAEDKTPARPIEQELDSQLVANQTPHGQKQLVYPNTATSAPLNFALAVFALLVLAMQRWVLSRRRNEQRQ
ncbi:MAG: marine proteobacterial sortase target protein [Cellvibrionaceae bacterium]